MTTILVTGVNGFVGRHLARELSNHNYKVVGIGREPYVDPSIKQYASSYYVCDLTDEASIAALPLSDIDAVISLAGLANVGASFDNPDLYSNVNVKVFTYLAERLLALNSAARVIAVSTGAVYDAGQTMPLTEESRLITNGSPYALSKIAMEKEVLRLHECGLDCVIVRPFNHIGPGQEGGFLLPDLYRKVMDARKVGMLKVGPLITRRDYTDVRDVVKAYGALAQAEKLDHAVYNVCSGHSVEGKKILDLLLKEIDPDSKITFEKDTSFKPRPNDPKDLYGSNQRLQLQTGWQPSIPLEQTIQDVVSNFKT